MRETRLCVAEQVRGSVHPKITLKIKPLVCADGHKILIMHKNNAFKKKTKFVPLNWSYLQFTGCAVGVTGKCTAVATCDWLAVEGLDIPLSLLPQVGEFCSGRNCLVSVYLSHS